MHTKKVAFYTLGCKLNYAETDTIARSFSSSGYAQVAFTSWADIYVINTCSVTEQADKRFRTIVKLAQKQNPDAFIAAIGCYAQLKPEELAKVTGVDLVLGASEKFLITDYIEDLSKREFAEIHACQIEEANFFSGSYAIGSRTRAFLKVQDGCDYKCTFCTIPLARGRSRSESLQKVVADAKKISDKGIHEIVLTGINIGDYGKGEFGNKRHEHTFIELLQALDQVSGVHRMRISSIEPNLLANEIMQFVADSKTFVPHFHIPLQSGNDVVLKAMKRRYQTQLYAQKVKAIKRLMPHACIGVDVIVGFPGETDAFFMDTYKFLSELPISYLHVFSYSERAHTPAASYEEVVPISVRKKRSKMLRVLSVKKRRAFYESQLNSTQTVLFESENKKGYIHGFTENYVKVKMPWSPKYCNTLHAVKLTNIDTDGLVRFAFTQIPQDIL